MQVLHAAWTNSACMSKGEDANASHVKAFGSKLLRVAAHLQTAPGQRGGRPAGRTRSACQTPPRAC